MTDESGARRVVALMGRRDSPTDAVEDYCTWLGRALQAHGWALEPVRAPWAESGWLGSLRWLRQQTAKWREGWVLVQYTALSWSRRGFPLGLLAVLWSLRGCQPRCAVVFHDAEPYPGTRFVDRVRRAVQRRVMRLAYRWSASAILNVPVERISWLPAHPGKAQFIPVGSNIPVPENGRARRVAEPDEKIVAVFGITRGSHGVVEIAAITEALRTAREASQRLKLVAFGRGTREAEHTLRRALDGLGVEVSVLGLLPAAELGCVLSSADVQLEVRGGVSSRRSSVMAAIACGVPVVGYRGNDTDPNIARAGVHLVADSDVPALGRALREVLGNARLREELRERNRLAQQNVFAWERIADQFLKGVIGMEK